MPHYRFVYSKVGNARYISHLELTKLFERAFRRNGIAAKYTEGFNPSVKLNFAAPLSVGQESLKEVAEVETTQDALAALTNLSLPNGIELLAVKEIEKGTPLMSRLGAAVYRVENAEPIRLGMDIFMRMERVEWQKKTKKGVTLVDMKAFVYSMSYDEWKLKAGNTGGINPQVLLERLVELTNTELGLLPKDLGYVDGSHVKIIRTDLLDEEGRGLYEFG